MPKRALPSTLAPASKASPSTRGLDGLHHSVELELSAAGQRYTAGRRQVVDALARSPRPLDMRAILRESPDLPQSSAYRTLSALSALGIVRRISGTDDSGYFELSERLIGRHHHHALCETCGRVVDIDSSPKLERALTEAAQIAMEHTGFRLDSHRIDLVGVCADCAV